MGVYVPEKTTDLIDFSQTAPNSGQVPTWDGTKYVPQTPATGGTSTFRLCFSTPACDLYAGMCLGRYIHKGPTVTITDIALSIATAPTGAAILADFHKNGTTVFADQAQRPTIVAGATSGVKTGLSITLADGDYMDGFVDQVGTTTPGTGPFASGLKG